MIVNDYHEQCQHLKAEMTHFFAHNKFAYALDIALALGNWGKWGEGGIYAD